VVWGLDKVFGVLGAGILWKSFGSWERRIFAAAKMAHLRRFAPKMGHPAMCHGEHEAAEGWVMGQFEKKALPRGLKLLLFLNFRHG
jgi:hypothetical protein